MQKKKSSSMENSLQKKKEKKDIKSPSKKQEINKEEKDEHKKNNKNEETETRNEENEEEEDEQYEVIDLRDFFEYQQSLNSFIDYLNQSIDNAIANFPRSDQLLFTHRNKKLILNAILERGFYDFCKTRLEQMVESIGDDPNESKTRFFEAINDIEGEIDLLAYLLVHTRLAHRKLNFDLYLSLLKGGLFGEILQVHETIVNILKERRKKVNKKTIQKDIHFGNYYI